MSREDEYRDHAMTMLGMAQRQAEPAEKSRLLAMAESWLALAERAARSPANRLRRLVRETQVSADSDQRP